MEQSIRITRFVEKSEEKTYIRVPFDIPDNVETVEIRYSYPGDKANSMAIGEKNVFDFALLDQNGGDIGATGSEYNHITVSASYSSPGYKRVEPVGRWTIILGAYLIRQGGAEIVYDITFRFKERRFLKGDTHVHTLNSDGRLSYAQIADKAKKAGLDYLIITDHNNSTRGLPLPVVDGLTVIPGLEFTSFFGHLNMWGVPTPYDGSYAVNNEREFAVLNKQADERGAVQSLNHPFCSLCPWKWHKDFIYQTVEVWNGVMREDNMKTIAWWQSELASGKRLGAVGGSDYHGTFPSFAFLGRPATFVYAMSRSQGDILTALREGRAIILSSPKAPMLSIESGAARVGDVVTLQEDTTVTVRSERLRRGETLRIFDASGEIYSHKATKSGTFEVTLPVKTAGFVRAETIKLGNPLFRLILRLALKFISPEQSKKPVPPMVTALTNPIYFQ